MGEGYNCYSKANTLPFSGLMRCWFMLLARTFLMIRLMNIGQQIFMW